ncbi:MAG: HAMP domain-containing protein [Archangium sp.]|nr:HAMP domain-containing protein [Archangium sp.]
MGTFWKNLSLGHKLYLTVGLMASLIVAELLTLRFAMRTLSAARAFVGGESLWSKAQKNAAINLQRYGQTRDDADFDDFLRDFEVPEGDHQARIELSKPSPDMEVVRQGFLRGAIAPDDIQPIIDLLRRFGWTPYVGRAIAAWTKADGLLGDFKARGLAYHRAVQAHDAAAEKRLLLEIKALNESLTEAEVEFSYVLGEGSRALEEIVLLLLYVAVMIVESLGLTLAFVISRSISRGLNELTVAADHIGRGDFSKVPVPRSGDEIGQLARSLGQMGALLQRSYGELEARVLERTVDLASSRDQLDVILRGITDGITVIDGQGRFVYVNEIGARMCGMPSVEAFLKTPQSAFFKDMEIQNEHGEPLPLENLPSRLAFKGVENPPEVVVRYRLNGGEERWSIIKSAPVFDASRKATLVVTIFKDFTEHKRSQEALKFLDECSILLNASLDYTTTLRSLAQMLVPRFADWSSVEVVEEGALKTVAIAHVDPAKVKLAYELQARWPPDPNAATGAANVLRTGKSELYPDIPPELIEQGARDEEHLRVSRALNLRSAMVVPLSARGKVLGAITIVWSDSNRRYAPSDLPLMEELGRRAGMAVDNARLYREAQHAINTRDDFLAMAGHELKTPLAALMMSVQSPLRAAKKGQPMNVAERLERAVRSGMRLERLIDLLLDVSTITAGRLRLEPATFDLAELVVEVVSRFVEDTETDDRRISVHAGAPLEGTWDRTRIDQVISNLISNAVKYGQGKPVEVSLTTDGADAVVRVVDHGIGIAVEQQQRIFEQFERAVGTHDFGGFGLGLWIAKKIVEASGGSIGVDSTQGVSTTFTVRLPLHAREPLRVAK